MSDYDSQTLLEASQVALDRFGDDFLTHLKSVLFDRTLNRTKVHPAIARMVHPTQESARLPTPRVFAIVTYNFDDMLEQAIKEAGYGATVHCSQRGRLVANRGGTGDRDSAVDIFHVHGIAPGGWPVDLSGIDLVFTEAQYDAQYGQESSVTRAVHRSFFTNALGLIIGSSLIDDYAVRELTEAHSARPGWYHYAIMRLPEELRSYDMQFTEETLEMLSCRYRPMGLRVIWIRDWEEIPGVLDAISGSTAH